MNRIGSVLKTHDIQIKTKGIDIMKDPFRNTEILMILPRRTILKAEPLPETWSLDTDPAGLSLYMNGRPVGYAFWKEASDFGMKRPAIGFTCSDEAHRLDIFEALVSRLAVAFDRIPGRYPLYIRLSSQNLDLIAKAGRMGFVPYFGCWSRKTSEQSESAWEMITERLRQRYPQGLSS